MYIYIYIYIYICTHRIHGKLGEFNLPRVVFCLMTSIDSAPVVMV